MPTYTVHGRESVSVAAAEIKDRRGHHSGPQRPNRRSPVLRPGSVLCGQ